MGTDIKDFVIGVIATAALIVAFSVACFPEDVPKGGNIGLEYPGDSGTVIPGGGDEIAEVVIGSEAVEVEIQESSESPVEVESEIETDAKIDVVITNIETEDNRMVGIVLSFWHGVAAVLIGEVAAIMVAIAYRKIRLVNGET